MRFRDSQFLFYLVHVLWRNTSHLDYFLSSKLLRIDGSCFPLYRQTFSHVSASNHLKKGKLRGKLYNKCEDPLSVATSPLYIFVTRPTLLILKKINIRYCIIDVACNIYPLVFNLYWYWPLTWPIGLLWSWSIYSSVTDIETDGYM